MREKLLGLHHDKWATEVQRFVESRGQPMNKAAIEAFQAGLISKNSYLMLTQGVE